MKYLLPFFGVFLLIGAGCATLVDDPLAALPDVPPGESLILDPLETSEPEDEGPDKTLIAPLEDVTGGDATGEARAIIYEEPKSYELTASFENLPEPEEDFFYEGWIVRKEPLSVISTGALDREDDNGGWSNTYSAEIDYSDHLEYVLTIEPDDGDPAPADHVLDGTFVLQK